MIEDDFRVRSCYRKKQYATMEEAKGVIKRLNKKGVKSIADQHAYQCQYCGLYHLGHRKVFT